jgi:two-component system KDP operon response regulator KdpE
MNAKSQIAQKNIFIVDDDPEYLELMQMTLQTAGYKVRTIQMGEEVVHLLKSGEKPDLLILDLWLPDWPGIDLLPRVKDAWPDTKVLVYTGMEEDQKQFLDVVRYTDRFLKKSSDISRLVECVRDLLA